MIYISILGISTTLQLWEDDPVKGYLHPLNMYVLWCLCYDCYICYTGNCNQILILQPMLPIGLSDVPGEAMVKLYCPKCCDVYTPKSSRHHHIDGAYFGTGFPHMLFMVHPEYRPKRPANQFVPRLYGFKIHPMAYQIQQQAAANFKAPMRAINYNNGKR